MSLENRREQNRIKEEARGIEKLRKRGHSLDGLVRLDRSAGEGGELLYLLLFADRVEYVSTGRLITAKRAEKEVIYYSQISDVQVVKALHRLEAKLIITSTSGKRIEIGLWPKFAESIASQIGSFQMRITPGIGVPPQTVDSVDQLRQLAELRDSGILTPEEFQQKKAEILERRW